MFLLGLTGSIAMGKSTAAAAFRAMGIPVFDADATVHRMFAPGGGAVAAVDSEFSNCITRAGGIDRERLARHVLDNSAALARLEAIVHPLVREAERCWLAAMCRQRFPLVVLDIPLLLETNGQRRMDAVAVVSAPAFIQEQRVMRRPGMNRLRLDAIRRRQMPDVEKRRRADYIIATGGGRDEAIRVCRAIVAGQACREGRIWPQHWE